MKVQGKELEQEYHRSLRLSRQMVDTEKRTVELSFSSEDPYERWFGKEVLGHKAGEIRLERLASGGHPLLLQHDQSQQIGVIEKAWVGDDLKGRATVRFAKATNKLAEEVFQDVVDGIRSLVSVGYRVHKFDKKVELDKDGEVDDDKTFYRATDWEPFEISLVAIPADATVGVGRHHIKDTIMEPEDKKAADEKARIELERLQKESADLAERQKQDAKEAEDAAKRTHQAKEDRDKIEKHVRNEETKRISEIYEIGNRFQKVTDAKRAVEKGMSVEMFKATLLDDMKGAPAVTQPEAGTGWTVSDNTSRRSIGEMFVTSEAYKSVGANAGQKRSVTLNIPDRYSFSERVTFSATTEALTSIQKLPGVPGFLNQQPLRVAQLFAQGTTTALTIRYIQEDAYTNAATAVAEGSGKPEATLDVSEVDATVRKIAVYLKITDEMFADHAQMQSYVDGRLGYMVEALEDNHLINGLGTTNQITGILAVSGIGTVSAGSYPNPLDAIQGAITNVRSVGFIEPDAVIVHPNDARDLLLTKDANGQYYGGGPFTGAYGVGGYSNVSNIWGLPLVSTTSIAEGTALVGSFRMGAQLWRRMGLTIESTNSDGSDFVNNLVTVRAETRLTLATYKPLAFCSVTGIA